MKTLYLHIQLIFCWLIITTTIQASDVNGFHLIRSGYYIDALNLFSIKNDSISKLGTQYCYLLMNNIKFDLEKTSEYIFSENLPDSILGWVALDIIKSFTKEKEKQIFWEKILSRMPITAYNEMQDFRCQWIAINDSWNVFLIIKVILMMKIGNFLSALLKYTSSAIVQTRKNLYRIVMII